MFFLHQNVCSPSPCGAGVLAHDGDSMPLEPAASAYPSRLLVEDRHYCYGFAVRFLRSTLE